MRRLESTFGIALLWLRSYLGRRSQFVRVGDQRSTTARCEYGVPQGSVLGPLLFAIYVAPIANVIADHGVSHAQYADDTQLYIALRKESDLSTISECFIAMHKWFAVNGLSLNPDKSEAITIGTGRRLKLESTTDTIVLGDTSIHLAKSVKSLGVTIDNTLSFDEHVANVCKAAHFHMRALRHIRKCIDDDTAKTIASSVIGARLDYCNLVLYGASNANIDKLQRVQNSLARIVKRVRRYDHITPALIELHWLPIRSRIQYKVALLTFKTMSTNRPSYLAELLSVHRPARELRSVQRCQLQVGICRTVFGSRAFRHAAATVWNSLPIELANTSLSLPTFKKHLKTHLYKQSFRY